jgi:hypothetical protein
MHDSWIELARTRRITLDDGRLSADTAAGRLTAFHARGDGSPATLVTLELEPPLGVRLEARELRAEDLDELWTNPAVMFDDPEFDDKVLVRGDEYTAKLFLGVEARRILLSLHALTDRMSLGTERIVAMVFGPPLAAKPLEALLERVENLGLALRPPRERAGNAYR